MASQVYSGAKDFSYTNNTGQNVRIIINFMSSINNRYASGGGGNYGENEEFLQLSWAGVTARSRTTGAIVIGKNIVNYFKSDPNSSFSYGGSFSSGGATTSGSFSSSTGSGSLPTEIMLAPNQSFSALCGSYNIVVIKEDGT